MNKIARTLTVLVALSVLVSACATAKLEKRIEVLERNLAMAKAENDALRSSKAKGLRVVPGLPIPPAKRRQPVGLNWAWLHQTPEGCDSPFLVAIHNHTNYWVRLYVDGREVMVRGAEAEGVLRYVPPRETVHMCIAHMGKHSWAGIGFARRLTQMVQVDKFKAPIWARQYDNIQRWRITKELFTFH